MKFLVIEVNEDGAVSRTIDEKTAHMFLLDHPLMTAKDYKLFLNHNWSAGEYMEWKHGWIISIQDRSANIKGLK